MVNRYLVEEQYNATLLNYTPQLCCLFPFSYFPGLVLPHPGDLFLSLSLCLSSPSHYLSAYQLLMGLCCQTQSFWGSSQASETQLLLLVPYL